jgi:hypothetical protein
VAEAVWHRWPVVTPAQALAARRLGVAAAALGATLLAHGVADGGLHPVPAAPALWGWLVMAAALAGPRRRPWRERGALRTIAVLVPAQALLHVAMGATPWAFGLRVHHAAPLLTTPALLAHLAAAALLGILLARAERLLTAAQAAARAIRAAALPRLPRAVVPIPRRAGPSPGHGRRPPRAVAARGPPPLPA